MDFETLITRYSIPALLLILASLWAVYIQPKVKNMLDKMEARWEANYNKDVKSREKLYQEIYFKKDDGIKMQSEMSNTAKDIIEIKDTLKLIWKKVNNA